MSVTLYRSELLELLRLMKLFPETVVMAVADPYLRVESWSLETGSIVAAETSA